MFVLKFRVVRDTVYFRVFFGEGVVGLSRFFYYEFWVMEVIFLWVSFREVIVLGGLFGLEGNWGFFFIGLEFCGFGLFVFLFWVVRSYFGNFL